MRLFNFSAKNCKNCYKCVRHCPVKAIRFRDNHAEIDEEKCIACGQCFVVCPKHARNVENDVTSVMEALNTGKRVYACLDSSYLGLFENPGQFVAGLKALGFHSVQEIAVGSEIVTKKSIEYVQGHTEQKYIISSSCPSIYLYITKYYPSLTSYLLPIVTPMTALGRKLKQEDPDGIRVYVGPCLSAKYETQPNQQIAMNYLITFEEVIRMFLHKFISIETLGEKMPDRIATGFGKNYSIAGDTRNELKCEIASHGFDYFAISGLENVTRVLDAMEQQAIDKAYFSIAACQDSCINGPFMPKRASDMYTRQQRLKRFVAASGWAGRADKLAEKPIKQEPVAFDGIDFAVEHEPYPIQRKKAATKEIEQILRKMDKYSRADELNCGACGYDSCRDKAQAVFEGMAEVTMCMPYMRSKAENMSDIIFLNARNMIILLDGHLNVLQINPSAERTFGVRSVDIVGQPISTLIDDSDFRSVLETQIDIGGKKLHYPKYGLTVIANIMYIKRENELILTLQNVTEEENRKAELDQMKKQTVDIAQNVIENQMRVAQEIAGLLGETTAKTKVALNKIKEIVIMDNDSTLP